MLCRVPDVQWQVVCWLFAGFHEFEMASRSSKVVLPAELLSKVVAPIYNYTASCCTDISRCSRQAALDRQDLSCTYLAHHQLESVLLLLLLCFYLYLLLPLLFLIIIIIQ